MPKRTDIQKIMIIGAGPIVIGQACEFDYSGTQACKALKEEGYEIVLVNSNPATIMTDPVLADRTYIEPLTVEALSKIIEKERPDALLPTVGGQTALNLAMDLAQQGVLNLFGVELIGASSEAIKKAEDRQLFKQAMEKIGLDVPKSFTAYTLDEVKQRAQEVGLPCVVRPAFTLGGTGGGIAYTMKELEDFVESGIKNSMISEVLVEESIIGWKEFELEVMRDNADNVVIVCSIENLDPMGVHTGDSITVAPSQTLSDREYQEMRNAAIQIIREIGVDTGGSNIQFAVDPSNGRMTVIEMNPRVSRSSALASKATGFPIAKLAAKLAVGYTLDELQNDITKKTPACFEPALDYVVVKIPRFNFDKFRNTKPVLGTAMKSVGEVMAIGRTFKESFQKGLRGLEIKRYGLGFDGKDLQSVDETELIWHLSSPNPERVFYIHHAFVSGWSVDKVAKFTKIDPWFLNQIKQIIDHPAEINTTEPALRRAKEMGFSDHQLAEILGADSEDSIRANRKTENVQPTFSLVDTCAGEFEAYTPYYYSTYETESEARISKKDKIMILGGGPNRIGQGIEFDYCCVHASFAVRDEGLESIMVNSNPETVSTDFDISDKLYFEPLTYEDVLNIYELEQPKGVIVQFGGQTPLNLAVKLEQAGVKLLGTSSDSIDRAENRERFGQLLAKLDLKQPANGNATSIEEAVAIARDIGFPAVVRPSYVLGGAAMQVVYNEDELKEYMVRAKNVSPSHPILIDRYLTNAVEVDVDCVADGRTCVVAGIMEHIEEAGIHSGDSACSLPTYSLSDAMIKEITNATKALAKELKVVGLMNIQFAIKEDALYVLEVNPRASRTVPFVSKATGIPWAKVATQVMLGKPLKDLKVKPPKLKHTAVKEAVFPFNKFPGEDILLGPEMRSTGEVMGIDKSFEMAYLKSQLAAGQKVPTTGNVFISLKDDDKPRIVDAVKHFIELGFKIYATYGTADYLTQRGFDVEPVKKIAEGRPSILDAIQNGDADLLINTASNKFHEDEILIRQEALARSVPVVTTIPGANVLIRAIREYRVGRFEVTPIQDYFPKGKS